MSSNKQDRIILLVDDDLDDAEIFVEAMNDVAPAIKCNHIETGLALFDHLSSNKNESPDLIVLNINMPKMNGWQCLAKLKNDPSSKDIPVVMYSTSSHQAEKEIASDLGASGFITKPTDYLVLRKILVTVCENIGRD